ncbi:hypothetical protein JK636_02900 [Clostridium sp. YIM B02515]|uniref:Uncharacterized protein n=1 Tax=Clostridium rhizosphaerae TaxID=2803861 RepID=A0ABS1T7G1_9CLOT|nr:hypothetical protein [Clostridium rhizosphaerae]
MAYYITASIAGYITMCGTVMNKEDKIDFLSAEAIEKTTIITKEEN